MRPLLALLLLLLSVAPAWGQTILFFSGFETGDKSEWVLSTNGTNWSVTSTGAIKTGAYVANIGTTNSAIRTAGGFAQATIFARLNFRWTTNSGDDFVLMFVNEANTHSLSLGIRGSDHKLYMTAVDGLGVVTAGATALTQNQWYQIDVKAVIDASVGGMEAKLDGNTEFSNFSVNTSALSPGVGFIQLYSAVGPSLDFRYDNIMVCSGAYCPSGGTIARQGAAGSPTYTAWTKNSCTSSLIENCWSQTPFNATPNASNAVANNAQTMLVSTFSATQSGHGSETISGRDTINACKTAMIAKSGTASAPLSIRRRIAGSDTDTSKTLTTSDAYYDDGIWTTGIANIVGATMEIGAVHGSGSATDTVEDMWMMCDYAAAAATTINTKTTQE